MNWGTRASKGFQAQQGWTTYDETEENRPEDFIDFRIREPQPYKTPEVRSVEAQVEADLRRWFAENVGNAVDSEPGDAQNTTSMSARGTDAPSSVIENSSQEVQVPTDLDLFSAETAKGSPLGL